MNISSKIYKLNKNLKEILALSKQPSFETDKVYLPVETKVTSANVTFY